MTTDGLRRRAPLRVGIVAAIAALVVIAPTGDLVRAVEPTASASAPEPRPDAAPGNTGSPSTDSPSNTGSAPSDTSSSIVGANPSSNTGPVATGAIIGALLLIALAALVMVRRTGRSSTAD